MRKERDVKGSKGFTPLEVNSIEGITSNKVAKVDEKIKAFSGSYRNVKRHFLSLTGFTLLELMVVCAIIVLLAGILVPQIARRLDVAKGAKAEGSIDSIETAVGMYKIDMGMYPESYNDDPDGDLAPEVSSGIELLEWRLTGRVTFNGYFAYNIGDIDPNIVNSPDWHGPYIKGIPKDSWGEDYVYLQNRYPHDPCPDPDPLICRQIDDPLFPLDGDYPVNGDGGCVAPARNLDFYIYSKGRNRITSNDVGGDMVVYEPAPDPSNGDDHDDDINNWDVNKRWREAD